MTSKCEVAINNAFNRMDWKKILLKDIGTFSDMSSWPNQLLLIL